jgi:DNA-binding NarL/FixJ family response regulator
MSADQEPRQQQTAKILIVDDHPMMREGLRVRISAQPDLTVCGEADDAGEALRQVRDTRPDLVIVDLSLRRGCGLDLIDQIKAGHPAVKILVVSQFDELLYAERSLRAGARGYLNKRECPEHVVRAIREVLAGGQCISPEVTAHLVAQAIDVGRSRPTDPVASLNNRELEVFQLIGHGATTASIARQLFLSVSAIKSRRKKICTKLGLTNCTELVHFATRWVVENG